MQTPRAPIIGLPDYNDLNKNTLPNTFEQKRSIKGTLSAIKAVGTKVYAKAAIKSPTTDSKMRGQANEFGGLVGLDEKDSQYYTSENLDIIYDSMIIDGNNDNQLNTDMFEE